MKLLTSAFVTAVIFLSVSLAIPDRRSFPPSGPAIDRAETEDVPAVLQQSVVRLSGHRAMGTGVVSRDAGGAWWAWTAAHVVLANSDFQGPPAILAARLPNGSVVPARLVRLAPERDVALLRIEADRPSLRSMTWHDRAVHVGDQVFHVGSPLGVMDGTVTSGIVSFVGRQVSDIRGLSWPFARNMALDQVSTPTWGGSSGGAICLINGRCIGLVHGGHGECMTLIVPAWQVREYARAAGVLFTIDPTMPAADVGPIKEIGGHHEARD